MRSELELLLPLPPGRHRVRVRLVAAPFDHGSTFNNRSSSPQRGEEDPRDVGGGVPDQKARESSRELERLRETLRDLQKLPEYHQGGHTASILSEHLVHITVHPFVPPPPPNTDTAAVVAVELPMPPPPPPSAAAVARHSVERMAPLSHAAL